MRRWVIAAALVLGTPAAALAAFPQTPPNDPLFDASPLPNATNEQWDLASPAGGFDRGISVDRAWRLSTGAGAVVADVDVGVQFDHPDLIGRWLENAGELAGNGLDDDRNGYVDDARGYDFYARDGDASTDTRNAHGTNVAGVLGAAADNGIGIAGIAPGAEIMALRTADNILHQGRRVAEALVYAADNGADVASMSLGLDSFSLSLRRATAYAERRGVVLVAAMGNEFHFHQHYPMASDEVIGVGGLNPDSANLTARDNRLALVGGDFRVRASYSDYGPHIDLVAPTQVPTTEIGGGYRLGWDGTSAATPHVAGVATLVVARGRELNLGLTPLEVVQILRATADDLAQPGTGQRPGWDRLTGWGRVNAQEAVARVRRTRIPPQTDIDKPDWYRPVRGAIAVTGRVHGRSPSRWELELGRGEEPTRWRTLAEGEGTGRRPRTLHRLDTSDLGAGGWTLRLRSRDAHGNEGVDRAFFRVLNDEALRPGFPRALGTSGEASPALADLDGDGAAEIVLATSDGFVRAYRGRGRRQLRGWPRRTGVAAGGAPVERRIGPLRAGFLATPAVGDIAGDARPEVVAAALDGRVHAWSASGRPLPGFPVAIDVERPPGDGSRDAAIYASPALADLDRDGRLDIVVGAADQHVYAWRGDGSRVPGWPVLARDREGGDEAKILSSPAVGDLDGDGSPDVVEGTAEAYGSTPTTTARVHAWNARGEPLPGWPVQPPALAADSIPLAGQGVPGSPALADVDGDGRDEVAFAAFTGQPELYKGDGTRLAGRVLPNRFDGVGRGSRSRADAVATLGLGASYVFGRTRARGPLRVFGGLVDARLAVAQTLPATRVEFEHLVGGWDAASGEWLPGFPAPIEGWTIVTAPAVADIDGDGRSEVIVGSSGNLLHAFREDGTEPSGWPKQTSGWLIAAPAVGDVDGDGLREVVAVTRDGWLFAWDTPVREDPRTADWPSFRQNTANTGRLVPLKG